MRLNRLPLLALVTLTLGAAPPSIVCLPGPWIIYFDRGSSAITSEARETIDNAIANQYGCKAVIAGHSDTSEDPSMARQRVLAVRKYLARHGVFVKQRDVQAFGAKNPRIKTPPKTQERQNRRVELTYAL